MPCRWHITPFQGFLYGGTVPFYIGPRPMSMDQALSGQKVGRTPADSNLLGCGQGPKSPEGAGYTNDGPPIVRGATRWQALKGRHTFLGRPHFLRDPFLGYDLIRPLIRIIKYKILEMSIGSSLHQQIVT